MAKKKSKLPIIIGAIVLLVGVGCLVFFLLFFKNSISINEAEIKETTNNNGTKTIFATLTKECNASEKGDYYVCEPVTITGKYKGGNEVIMNDPVDDFVASDNKISFTAKEVSYKKVAVREENITSTSNNYELVMKNEEGKELIVYKLEVITTLNDEDNALINAEPNENAIAEALKTVETISEVCILNEDTDPNNNIGKDGQYYIKVSYIDNRVDKQYYGEYDFMSDQYDLSKSCTERGVDAGGSIEVFKTKDDAQSRKDYLDAFATGILNSGKSQQVNTTLIRVSPNLKASEQDDLLEKVYQALTQ